ncbi:hypothetical protein GCM10028820_04610 [Tessaracoccus terricola]
MTHHTAAPDLAAHRRRLEEACAAVDGVTSLVFYGSSTRDGEGRRDEWSDLDFNVFLAPEAAHRLRAGWPFLPEPDRLVLTAREGDNGGVALYDDAMVYEFGAGLAWQVTDPAREVALDGGDLRFGAPPEPPSAENQVRLFLVKLFIGVGRHRRGERVAASAHVRGHALVGLCWALRRRLAPQADAGSPFDPLRRLEQHLPGVAARLGDLLDLDLEVCARGLLRLAREELEPGWDGFPSAAADVVEARLGWAPVP